MALTVEEVRPFSPLTPPNDCPAFLALPGFKETNPILACEQWKTLLASSSEINRLVDVKEAELDQRAEGEQEVVREREEEKLREKRGEERATV